MTRLTLERFTGPADLPELDADVDGTRIALVGEWSFLFELASGRGQPVTGQLVIDGSDVRDATVAGRMGVADPSMPTLPGYSIAEWVEAHCRLQGHSPKQAKENTRVVLDRLGLSYLGRYRLENLPEQTLYAARAALAAATAPTTLLLAAPPWTEETRSFDQALLDALNRQCGLLISCDPARQPELFLSCDVAVVLGQEGLQVQTPQQLWSTRGTHYAVVAWGDPAPLAVRLAECGASVSRAGALGELWVSMPAGADTALLVQSALDTNTALRSVLPLLETPSRDLGVG